MGIRVTGEMQVSANTKARAAERKSQQAAGSQGQEGLGGSGKEDVSALSLVGGRRSHGIRACALEAGAPGSRPAHFSKLRFPREAQAAVLG